MAEPIVETETDRLRLRRLDAGSVKAAIGEHVDETVRELCEARNDLHTPPRQ